MSHLKVSTQLLIALLSGLLLAACGGGGSESPEGSIDQAEGSQLSDYAGLWVVDQSVMPEGVRISGILIDDDGYMSLQYFVEPLASAPIEVIHFGFADVNENRLVLSSAAISTGPLLGGVQAYSRDLITIEMEFAANGDLLVSVEHPEGGFDDVRFGFVHPLNSGEFNSLLANTWYTNPVSLNTSEVRWELRINSEGMVAGSYQDSCALTGAIEPSMHDGFFHRISLEAGGCVEANSFYGTIFAIDASIGVFVVMYIVNEDGQPDLINFGAFGASRPP